ncbi:MAG TPA: hypothetical protein VNK23_05540 [Candidatus Dormibacteraeota bacterium]|nr:hypothetical protein [Candidatus Dormibacteraeota bacterium]
MDVRAIFGLGVLMSFVSSAVLAKLYVWPWLQAKARREALVPLVAPHMLLRFVGLSFLIPGVVSSALPTSFTFPAAYGDFAAGVLAIIATVALARRASWAVAAVWTFNIWGAADLLLAFYEAAHAGVGNHPGIFGPAYYIPTAIVPPLLGTHVLIFGQLVRQPAWHAVETGASSGASVMG